MAGSAVIGALRVVLGADTAAFDDGLKKASSRLDSFASGMAKAGAAIGVAVAGAATALGVSVLHSIEQADKLGKAAQKIGIPVEELSKLKFAAELSDVSLEQLTNSVGKLSKNMTAVAGGDVTGAAQRAFEALGVSVTGAGGKMKPTSDLIVEISGRFEKFEDGAAKTALAIALFGKSGAELIPLLNSGAVGLKNMMHEAEQLGIVIDEKTAKASEEFNDNLKRLSKTKDALILKITTGLSPAMASLSEAMVKAAKDSDLMKTASDAIVSVFKFSTEVGLTLTTVVTRLSAEINGLVQAGKLLASGEFAKAFSVFKAAGEETDKVFAALKERLATLWDAPAAAIEAAAPETSKKIAAPIIQAQSEMAGFKAFAEKLVAETNALWEQTRTPAEELAARQERLNALFQGGAINAEVYGRAMQQAAEKAGTTWDLAGASIAGSFSKIAGAFGKENKAMATAAKAFGIVQATISMFTGAAKALELPWPANIAAMLAVLAQGASLIASITSTSVPGAAKGGSFMMPGGMSMTDNMIMPIALASGERVDVTPANEVGRSRSSDVTVNLSGERVGRDRLRELFDTLNEGFADGYKLTLAPA
jgi:hypothetical protein